MEACDKRSLLVPIFKQDVINAAFSRHRPGLAARDGRAGKALQLQGDMLSNMSKPRAFGHTIDQPANAAKTAMVAPKAG